MNVSKKLIANVVMWFRILLKVHHRPNDVMRSRGGGDWMCEWSGVSSGGGEAPVSSSKEQ